MELHHSKHHQTYVDKLNEAFQKSDLEVDDANLATMLTHIDEQPESVRQALRNHGGGHYNHSLFWKWMSPDGGGSPTDQLASSINDKYGSYQKFVDEFTTKSLSVFGSGWCWLMPDMSIVTTANQDNPLMSSQKEPLLGSGCLGARLLSRL
jgi:Fe-Mn family superoxide dismutase